MKNPEIYELIMELTLASGLSRHDGEAFYAAYEVALGAAFQSFPMGCVIVSGGRVLASGSNSLKSDPLQKHYNLRYRNFTDADYCAREHSLHAETAALKSVRYPIAKKTDWGRAKAYIYRIAPGLPLKQGLAAPCSACAHALADYGIRKVYFSTEYGFAESRLIDDGRLLPR